MAFTKPNDNQMTHQLNATGSVVRTLKDKLGEVVSVKDFGAVGDGVTDDSNAFIAACNYCYQNGVSLHLESKVYKGARIELHGSFNVYGNGATVDYLGVGTTYIAGTGSGNSAIPTAWGQETSYDPNGWFTPVMYSLSGAVSIGDQTITLGSVTGLSVGMYLFLADKPSSMSSNGNYIPTNFEYVKIQSISGNVVTLVGRVKNPYTNSGAVFYSAGLAVNCRVSDIRLTTSHDAYQYVVRSAYNVELENIEFAGQSAVGASTFTDNLRYKNIKVVGTYGPLSTARGTVSAYIDGLDWVAKTGNPAQDTAIFIEESFYKIDIRNVRSYGGMFSIRSVDMSASSVGRSISVSDSIFDTTNASSGATAPLQNAVCIGFDQCYRNITFVGTPVTPDSGPYPGISGSALAWITNTLSGDTVRFSACKFISNVIGKSLVLGSGFIGTCLFDNICSFVNVYPAKRQWSNITINSPFTTISGYSAPVYRLDGNDVVFEGSIQINSATSGSILFTLPVGYRPIANKLLTQGSAQTGTATSGSLDLSVDTSGNVTATWSSSVAYIGLSGIKFAIDV